MLNPRVGYDETDNLGYIFHKHLTPTDRVFKAHYDQVLKIGSYITAMHLPDGSVVADTFGNCVPEVITTIPNPRVFVITNDRDFQKVLADPPQFKARYLLLVDPAASQVVSTPSTAPTRTCTRRDRRTALRLPHISFIRSRLGATARRFASTISNPASAQRRPPSSGGSVIRFLSGKRGASGRITAHWRTALASRQL